MSPQQQRRTTKENPLIIIAILLISLRAVVGFETYYMDHEVTEQQARKALQVAFNTTLQDGRPNWCSPCTEEINNYCLSVYLIQDHCCCDQGHRKENMPWMPHSCYMGEETCKPAAKSCFDYMNRRQCCCDRLLVEAMFYELSAAIVTRPHLLFIFSIVMLTVLHKSFNY